MTAAPLFRPSFLVQHLGAWLRAHRPLAWMDGGFGGLQDWRPDPPVMERLIR